MLAPSSQQLPVIISGRTIVNNNIIIDSNISLGKLFKLVFMIVEIMSMFIQEILFHKIWAYLLMYIFFISLYYGVMEVFSLLFNIVL